MLNQPADLLQHSCLHMNANEEQLKWQLVDGEKKQMVKTKPSFRSNDFSTLRQLTIDDCGIALLPDYLCQQQIKDKTLVRVLDW